MSDAKATAFDWDHLTDHHASILEAYFALYQERDPTTIGSGEILRWFRERERNAPSEALIRTVLAAVQAPRRSGGRPALATRADARPPFVHRTDERAASPTLATQVASVLLPALVADELHTIAQDHAQAHPEGVAAERVETWLGTLVPRVVFPGGWAAAARQAGAEPLATGRSRAYDASTLRKAATRLDAEGGTARVAQAVWRQVTQSVAAMDEPVIAHTDVFDPPFYTKRVAHAAPIGRLGNRLLAATYFGVTTVAIPRGPTLLAHLSWHKPGAPLRDALGTGRTDARQVRLREPRSGREIESNRNHNQLDSRYRPSGHSPPSIARVAPRVSLVPRCVRELATPVRPRSARTGTRLGPDRLRARSPRPAARGG